MAGGEPFIEAMRHGTMSVEVFAPPGVDNQRPRDQDEFYFVAAGSAEYERQGKRMQFSAGDVPFVQARDQHRFHGMSAGFIAWVVFWGPQGGER